MASDQEESQTPGGAAHLVLIDESGLLMAPLARRTWAPRGQTPSLTQAGGPRKKVSVAAALWLSPRRDRLGLYFHTLADGYFDNWYVTAFLEALLHDLAGRFVIIWDGGTMHKGEPIRAPEAHFGDRLSLERLPPLTPVLNPVESLWSWLKYLAAEQFCPARSGRRRWPGDRRVDDGSRRSGVPAEPVPCFGTPNSADITFLTVNKIRGNRKARRRELSAE